MFKGRTKIDTISVVLLNELHIPTDEGLSPGTRCHHGAITDGSAPTTNRYGDLHTSGVGVRNKGWETVREAGAQNTAVSPNWGVASVHNGKGCDGEAFHYQNSRQFSQLLLSISQCKSRDCEEPTIVDVGVFCKVDHPWCVSAVEPVRKIPSLCASEKNNDG